VTTSNPENTVKPRSPRATPACIGLVVHPSRPLEVPLLELRQWAGRRTVELVQLPAFTHQQQVAAPGNANDCDLIVSIGGDGTTLAAIRAGIGASRPVLGIACGSLGVLTAVAVDQIARALERFSEGDWIPRPLPALDVRRDVGEPMLAINDLAVVRAGEGQVRVRAHVDGALFARFSGDGCIVSTPVGSSAYALSAGGPLLAPDTNTFVLTPLSAHGGAHPPLVLAAGGQLTLDTTAGYGGARLELDGQVADTRVGQLRIGLRPAVTTIVGFDDQEPFLAGLRRRNIIADSPRIVAEDARSGDSS
jgi:NAD+ kinase